MKWKIKFYLTSSHMQKAFNKTDQPGVGGVSESMCSPTQRMEITKLFHVQTIKIVYTMWLLHREHSKYRWLWRKHTSEKWLNENQNKKHTLKRKKDLSIENKISIKSVIAPRWCVGVCVCVRVFGANICRWHLGKVYLYRRHSKSETQKSALEIPWKYWIQFTMTL